MKWADANFWQSKWLGKTTNYSLIMHRCVNMSSDSNSLYINCFTILQKWSKWPSWYTPLIEVNQAKMVWSFRQTFHTLQKLYTNSKQLSTQRDAENVYFSLQWVIIWKRFRSNTLIIFQFFGGSYFFNIFQFLLVSEICVSLLHKCKWFMILKKLLLIC